MGLSGPPPFPQTTEGLLPPVVPVVSEPALHAMARLHGYTNMWFCNSHVTYPNANLNTNMRLGRRLITNWSSLRPWPVCSSRWECGCNCWISWFITCILIVKRIIIETWSFLGGIFGNVKISPKKSYRQPKHSRSSDPYSYKWLLTTCRYTPIILKTSPKSNKYSTQPTTSPPFPGNAQPFLAKRHAMARSPQVLTH